MKQFYRWVVVSAKGKPMDIYNTRKEALDVIEGVYASKYGPFTVQKIKCEPVT